MSMTETENRVARKLAQALHAVPEQKQEYLIGFLEGLGAQAPINPPNPDTGQNAARPGA